MIYWVKQTGQHLPNAYDPDGIPEVGELDDLETLVGSKEQNLAMDGGRPSQSRHFGLGFDVSAQPNGVGRPSCKDI